MTSREEQDPLEAPTAILRDAGVNVDYYRPKVESFAAYGWDSHDLCAVARGLVKVARRRGEIT